MLLVLAGTFKTPAARAVENPPQRIISLAPSVTEEIYLLGADDRLVGCTVYCARPPEAKRKEKVGAAIEVNVEKVIAMKPDLVIATSLTDLDAKEKLKGLGIRVADFPSANSFEEICGQFLRLGELVGKKEAAENIVATAKTKVDSLKKRVAALPRSRVFVQIGSKPLVTVTKGTFINDFIELGGGANIVNDVKYARYSREKVLADNPDVIIIAAMGYSGEGERRIWKGYKTLRAAREDRIYVIDSSKLCSPTPLSFVETLEEIAAMLHPNLS
jgi:iron complex transport system substrate-binding protein